MRRAAILAVLAVALCAPTERAEAQAEGRKPILAPICLASMPQNARDAAEACGHLDGLLGALDSHRLADVDRLTSASEDFDPLGALDGVEAQLSEGIADLKAGRDRRGARSLARGFEGLIALSPWIKDQGVMDDALLWMLIAEVRLRSRDIPAAAERALNQSPALRAGWRDRVQDPDVQAALEAAERKLDTTRPGRIEVQSVQSGARVTLDGRFMGVTPLRIGPVAPGEHLLIVRKTGYAPEVQLVTVEPSTLTPVESDLQPVPNLRVYDDALTALADEIGDGYAGQPLLDLKALWLVDQIVALRVSEDVGGAVVYEAFLYDMRSSQLLTKARIASGNRSFEGRRANMDKLIAALFLGTTIEVDDPIVGGGGGGGGGGVDSGDGPIWNEWWFWAGAGTIALGAVLTGVLLSADDGGEEAQGPTGQGGVLLRF